MDQLGKPNFTFINLSHPDDLKDQQTIDHIRCSAMTNFGRMRRKRRPKKERNQIVFEVLPPESIATGPVALSRVGLETLDPFAALPFTMDANACRVTTDIFGANNGQSPQLLQAWSSVGFHDDLSFQTSLSVAALNGEILRRGGVLNEDTPESLQLYNRALQMINQRLDDPEQHTAEAVVGSMSGFLTHDYIIGDFENWNRHMDGLLKMIRLRGGMESLTTEQLHITLAWVDVCGSYSQDIPPHLPLPASWLAAIGPPLGIDPSSFKATSPIGVAWMQELSDSHFFISIFERLMAMSHDPLIPWNSWMEPVLHTLLSYRPLKDDEPSTRTSIIEEVCRLGTLIGLAPVWRTFGIHPVRTNVLRTKLLMILNKYFAEWGLLRPLLVWVLMHATREADTEHERSEFAMRLGMVMDKLGAVGWDGLVSIVNVVVQCDGSQEQGGMWDEVKNMLNNSVSPDLLSMSSTRSAMAVDPTLLSVEVEVDQARSSRHSSVSAQFPNTMAEQLERGRAGIASSRIGPALNVDLSQGGSSSDQPRSRGLTPVPPNRVLRSNRRKHDLNSK